MGYVVVRMYVVLGSAFGKISGLNVRIPIDRQIENGNYLANS
jgi:hypothetical protein